MVYPPGVTIWRNGDWRATSAIACSSAGARSRAKRRSTTAPGASGSCHGGVSLNRSSIIPSSYWASRASSTALSAPFPSDNRTARRPPVPPDGRERSPPANSPRRRQPPLLLLVADQYALPPGGSCGSRPPGSAAAPARPATERRCPADPAAAIPAAGCIVEVGENLGHLATELRGALAQLGVGKRWRRSSSNAVSLSPGRTAQTPRSLCATRQRPSAQSPVVRVTTVAAPPRRN